MKRCKEFVKYCANISNLASSVLPFTLILGAAVFGMIGILYAVLLVLFIYACANLILKDLYDERRKR